jgi:hypothetical protein
VLRRVLEVTETEAGEICPVDEASQELVFKVHQGLQGAKR